MRLPNGDLAIVPLARITDYLLNPSHPVGKHKARVFAGALGMDMSAAGILEAWLQETARTGDAEPGVADAYGARFVITAQLRYNGREAQVRTAWIVRTGQAQPEFLTAYVE